MDSNKLLEQRLQQVSDELARTQREVRDFKKEVTGEFKEMNKRVNDQDTSIAKIELMIEGMKTSWVKIETDISNMIQQQQKTADEARDAALKQQENSTKQQKNLTSAFKEIVIEVIKGGTIVVGAILGARMFL